MRFEAIEFPHGNCVVEKPGDLILAAFASAGEAQMYAETLTRWIESRPEPHQFRVYRDFDGPPRPVPTEYDLLGILDRLEDPERKLDLLEDSLGREFALLKNGAGGGSGSPSGGARGTGGTVSSPPAPEGSL